MKVKKDVILHLILEGIKAGKNPAKISKENKIKKQTLQYYLRQLTEKGIIEKEGYGIWKVLKEVSISTKASKIKKQIRGHAFNWKVKLKYNVDWIKRLKDNNISYNLIGIGQSTPRIIFNGKKIWLTKTGMVIYEPKSFFDSSSIASKGKAVYELDKTIKMLSRRLKIDLERYYFTTSREHYGIIENELARQYNNKGKKLIIKRKDGTAWLWIDDSHSLNELENDEPMVNRQVQNWYNDMKDTKFEVTPTFILEAFNKVKENLELTQKELHTLKQENSLIKSQLNKFEINTIKPDYIN